MVVTSTGKTLFKPYVVKKLNGVKIGFIGMTLKGTPDIVTAAGVQGLSFLDEVTTAIAGAVEEQGAATREISQNVQMASQGTQTLSSNISSVNGAISVAAKSRATA